MKSLMGDFMQFVYTRCDAGQKRLLLNDPEYHEKWKKYSQLLNKIKELLGKENCNILLDLDSVNGDLICSHEECAYKTGFTDGINFLMELGLLDKKAVGI